MLSLKRFKALADSYGASPQRWPEAVRADAEALLRISPEARQLLAEARELDDAISAARETEKALSWSSEDEAAAVSRLRARVAARIAVADSRPPAATPPGWLQWPRGRLLPVAQWSTPARVAGMAAASGFIIAVGLLLGSMEVTQPPAQADVLAMLQPDPLPFPADE